MLMFHRKTVFYMVGLTAFVSAIHMIAYANLQSGLLFIATAGLFILGIHDQKQTKKSVLRNYPIIGHLRYLIESFRPEIRQYLLEDDHEQQPFSRAQRSVVYQRAKNVSDVTPFGTKVDVHRPNHEYLTHSMSPSQIVSQDFRIQIGETRKHPVSLSVFNISAMSFGSLSANAIRALNKGAKMGGFAHDTGEGAISPYHEEFSGDLIWEIGSGYFGCRDEKGNFSAENFQKNALKPQVKMIEIKLSQGAKPGHGGMLPASKVTPEIAQTRGIPLNKDCISPAAHSAFSTPEQLMNFIQQLRELSDDKPVGIKLCIGHQWEFLSMVKAMIEKDIYPDFIVVDGAEGGTGAAPMEFADHIGTPLQEGLLFVHNTLTGFGIRDKIKIGASGKIITAFDMARTFALGADWCNSARGFLFSLGCIQGLTCHTGNCPTGIATQDPERQKALDVEDKSNRVKNFHHNTLHALQELLQSAGLTHPKELKLHHFKKKISPEKTVGFEELYQVVHYHEFKENISYEPVKKYWNNVNMKSFNLQ